MTTDLIEEACRALDVRARLEGPNKLVLLDVDLPKDAPAEMKDAMHAARALHHSIEVDDGLADIEETLEDALKGGDVRAIDDGCELYRALLASRLKEIAAAPEGQDRLAALACADITAHSAPMGR